MSSMLSAAGSAVRSSRTASGIRHAAVSELDAVVVQYHWSFFSVSALAETIRALVGAGIQVFLDLHNTRGPPDGIADDADVIAALARCKRVLVHTLDDVARAESRGPNEHPWPLATYHVQEPSQGGLRSSPATTWWVRPSSRATDS